MLYKKYWTFVIFLGISLVTTRQSLVITGQVYDAETKLLMPYANIASQSNSIGTATNLFGEFKLIIPNKSKKDSLIASFIGYNSKFIAVPNTSQSIDVILELVSILR